MCALRWGGGQEQLLENLFFYVFFSHYEDHFIYMGAGRSQDLVEGQELFFSDFEICALLRCSGACSPDNFFLNDAIWCVLLYIWIRVVLKTLLIKIINHVLGKFLNFCKFSLTMCIFCNIHRVDKINN